MRCPSCALQRDSDNVVARKFHLPSQRCWETGLFTVILLRHLLLRCEFCKPVSFLLKLAVNLMFMFIRLALCSSPSVNATEYCLCPPSFVNWHRCAQCMWRINWATSSSNYHMPLKIRAFLPVLNCARMHRCTPVQNAPLLPGVSLLCRWTAALLYPASR